MSTANAQTSVKDQAAEGTVDDSAEGPVAEAPEEATEATEEPAEPAADKPEVLRPLFPVDDGEREVGPRPGLPVMSEEATKNLLGMRESVLDLHARGYGYPLSAVIALQETQIATLNAVSPGYTGCGCNCDEGFSACLRYTLVDLFVIGLDCFDEHVFVPDHVPWLPQGPVYAGQHDTKIFYVAKMAEST